MYKCKMYKNIIYKRINVHNYICLNPKYTNSQLYNVQMYNVQMYKRIMYKRKMYKRIMSLTCLQKNFQVLGGAPDLLLCGAGKTPSDQLQAIPFFLRSPFSVCFDKIQNGSSFYNIHPRIKCLR